jgi:hypothetical protein
MLAGAEQNARRTGWLLLTADLEGLSARPALNAGSAQNCAGTGTRRVRLTRHPRGPARAGASPALIPEPADQIGHRKNRGSRGGRPVDFDAEDYKGRNVIERAFNKFKNWRGLATRYDKHALVYRGGMVLVLIVLWLQV